MDWKVANVNFVIGSDMPEHQTNVANYQTS